MQQRESQVPARQATKLMPVVLTHVVHTKLCDAYHLHTELAEFTPQA